MRNRNQVVIPMDLGIRIDENAPVRKLIEICDELESVCRIPSSLEKDRSPHHVRDPRVRLYERNLFQP